MKRLTVALLAGMLLAGQFALSSPAEARKLTITQRQNILKQKINTAQRRGDLTLKEANHLRDDLRDVYDREAKMRDKNGGKLSYKNITDIEKDLNRISVKIQKKGLEKRVQ
ncbi:MAG: hypothetical protein J0H83_06470 [Candidatus Melainabacteria bacterium]|jgi:hypothetical protein|nr:hypothetical protein [Candidatus Melainabacteria bacterium]MBX9673456.1 hypothetical protein [Candidatus Obscuribacterales bacterium]